MAPTPDAPARARAAVSAWLAEHAGDTVPADVALLLISELVTNSVRHARIGAGDALRLSGRLGLASVRLAIWDRGTQGTVAQRARSYGADAGGFGLELVERLSSAWGVQRDAHGTTVWLELAVPPS